MNPEKDAFGQHLLACLHSGSGHEIIERDDGHIDIGPGYDVYFSKPSDWSSHDIEALKRAKGRVLDVGMGAGRHVLYLQEQGYEVIGIDNSPLSVHVAKERGVKDARVMSIDALDESLGIIDTIIMMGNNWGLLGGFEEGQHLLKSFAQFSADNAYIIASIMNPYSTNDPSHLNYHQRNREKGRMGGQIRFRVRYKQYCGDWMDYLFCSLQEVEQIIAGTGWKLKEIFGNTDAAYSLILEKQ